MILFYLFESVSNEAGEKPMDGYLGKFTTLMDAWIALKKSGDAWWGAQLVRMAEDGNLYAYANSYCNQEVITRANFRRWPTDDSLIPIHVIYHMGWERVDGGLIDMELEEELNYIAAPPATAWVSYSNQEITLIKNGH